MNGSVSDGMMKKLVEWRQGSVNGNRNQGVRVCKGEGRVIEEGQGRKQVHGYCPRCNVMVSRSGREDQKEKQGHKDVQLGQ